MEAIISKKPITKIRPLEYGLEVTFKDGESIKIYDNHEQDCCERVYADWSILELYRNQLEGKPYWECQECRKLRKEKWTKKK